MRQIPRKFGGQVCSPENSENITGIILQRKATTFKEALNDVREDALNLCGIYTDTDIKNLFDESTQQEILSKERSLLVSFTKLMGKKLNLLMIYNLRKAAKNAYDWKLYNFATILESEITRTKDTQPIIDPIIDNLQDFGTYKTPEERNSLIERVVLLYNKKFPDDPMKDPLELFVKAMGTKLTQENINDLKKAALSTELWKNKNFGVIYKKAELHDESEELLNTLNLLGLNSNVKDRISMIDEVVELHKKYYFTYGITRAALTTTLERFVMAMGSKKLTQQMITDLKDAAANDDLWNNKNFGSIYDANVQPKSVQLLTELRELGINSSEQERLSMIKKVVEFHNKKFYTLGFQRSALTAGGTRKRKMQKKRLDSRKSHRKRLLRKK